MRLATITLALAGLLSLGATRAVAQDQPFNAPTSSYLTTSPDPIVVTPVARYVWAAKNVV